MPRLSRASAALSPPMPAPTTMTLFDAAMPVLQPLLHYVSVIMRLICCRAARSLCTMANHSVSASGSPHAFIRVRLPIRTLLGAFHRPLGVLAIKEQHLLAHAVSLAGTDLRAV